MEKFMCINRYYIRLLAICTMMILAYPGFCQQDNPATQKDEPNSQSSISEVKTTSQDTLELEVPISCNFLLPYRIQFENIKVINRSQRTFKDIELVFTLTPAIEYIQSLRVLDTSDKPTNTTNEPIDTPDTSTDEPTSATDTSANEPVPGPLCTEGGRPAEYIPFTFSPATEDKPATVSWKLGDILPQQTVWIEVQLKTTGCPGRHRNFIKVHSLSSEETIAPIEAFWDVRIYALRTNSSAIYDTEDPVEVGQTTTYVVEIRNEGEVFVEDLVLVCDWDDELRFVSARGPTTFYVENDIIRFDPIPQFAPCEKVTFLITCLVVKPGSAKMRARFDYKGCNYNLVDEEGTTCYE